MSPDPTPSPTQADGGPDPHPGQDDPAPRRGLSAAQVADAVRAGRRPRICARARAPHLQPRAGDDPGPDRSRRGSEPISVRK